MAGHRGPVALAALAVITLSGCGARPDPAGSPSITPTDPTTTTTTTTAPPPSTQTGGETAPPTQDNPCTAQVLTGRVETQNAAAGQRHAKLVLTNESLEPCTLWGFGNLELLDRTGNPVPTQADRNLDPQPALVTLAPKAKAEKTLQWTVVATGDEPVEGPCQPQATSVRVTPPDETEAFGVDFDFGSVCDKGRIATSAYFAS